MKIICNWIDDRSAPWAFAGDSVNCVLLQAKSNVCVSIVKYLKNMWIIFFERGLGCTILTAFALEKVKFWQTLIVLCLLWNKGLSGTEHIYIQAQTSLWTLTLHRGEQESGRSGLLQVQQTPSTWVLAVFHYLLITSFPSAMGQRAPCSEATKSRGSCGCS